MKGELHQLNILTGEGGEEEKKGLGEFKLNPTTEGGKGELAEMFRRRTGWGGKKKNQRTGLCRTVG